MKHTQQSAGRRTVRASELHRRIDDLDDELGFKFSKFIERYHLDFVEPMRKEIAWLKTPWWRKLWIYLKRFGRWLRGWKQLVRLERVQKEKEEESEPREAGH